MNKYNIQQLRGAWGAGRAAQTKADGIAGKWFHSFKDGYVYWQGQVLSAQPADHFLVQLYEWLGGSPNKQVIVPFLDMVGWVFYDSSEQMMFEWEHRLAPSDDEHRRLVLAKLEEAHTQTDKQMPD